MDDCSPITVAFDLQTAEQDAEGHLWERRMGAQILI